MRKISAFLLLILMVLQASCCFDISGKEKKFRKRMLCARRVNNENSIRLLKNGAFCCPRLPAPVSDISSARRYYYLKAAEIFPDRDEVLESIGQTYWEEGKFAEALDYYRKALKSSPGNIKYLVAIVTLNRIERKYDDALDAVGILERADFDGREKTVDYLKGKILYEKNDLDSARKLLEQTLQYIEPQKGNFYLGPTPYTMKDVYFYLALIGLKKNETQKAHEYFLQYISKEGHPDFVSVYQDCLKKTGGEQAFLYDMVEENWTRTHQ